MLQNQKVLCIVPKHRIQSSHTKTSKPHARNKKLFVVQVTNNLLLNLALISVFVQNIDMKKLTRGAISLKTRDNSLVTRDNSKKIDMKKLTRGAISLKTRDNSLETRDNSIKIFVLIQL